MIEIDGTYGEGGGQIVRTALALSALMQNPFRVTDIRKGRTQPGLKSQHLHAIKALKELCNADVNGDYLGSTNLEFIPNELNARNISINIGTAGSITLVLQSLLLPLIFLDKKTTLTIIGGTDTKWSPQFDYIRHVFLPQVKRFGDVSAILNKRGYYPKGNGKVVINVIPKLKKDDIKNININLVNQGKLLGINGISHADYQLKNSDVAERQSESAKNFIEQKYNTKVRIGIEYSNTDSIGSGITLWGIFSNSNIIGSDSLGERGKKAESVGEEAASNLMKEIESGAAIDRNMADQILPYLALAKGAIKTSKLTGHCKTNIYTIERFLGRVFEVDEGKNIINVNDTFINQVLLP